MNRYSETSETRLNECHPDLQKVFWEVLKTFDHSILVGFRGEEDQNKAYFLRRSRLKWPQSKHNQRPSLAVDAAPYPVDFNDLERICLFAGFVLGTAKSLNIPIRWGGDWDRDMSLIDEKFRDLVHFELVV